MSDDDWDVNPTPSAPMPASALPPRVPVKKWDDEDVDDQDNSDDDWDKSSGDEKAKSKTVAVPKKKGTLKQKLEEKDRLAKERAERGEDDDGLIDTMTEQDKRRLAREKEKEADLAVASDLMGDMDLGDAGDIKSILLAKPATKNDFTTLSKDIYSVLLKKHELNPLYSHFVEQLAKDASAALTAVQTRKVSSALSVLGNTKQQEERDKTSGKKKSAAKPKLGGAKVLSKVDTEVYDDVLEDDDFM
ncbi:uncharacterized protein L203_105442 [Cryptococcus depauperatus CBS 7841]|uniref:Eukaryotic translation initiation factor 3 subunit J n=1 Tax=Cryptococcus depauperatus CBS 7841 TaxID=1295531 RepID=A0AAJ8JXH7_9TREE